MIEDEESLIFFMNKLLIILLTLFTLNSISTNVLAEVNIDLLKQKYFKCEDISYRDDCFDEFYYGTSRSIGYFRNNRLWDGLNYSNGILNSEYVNGKRIAKSVCQKNDNGWTICPSGTRYKAMKNGYHNKDGKQGNFIVEFQSGNKYIGEYKNGLANGQGSITFATGGKYIGQFKNNMQHGQGKYTYANGKVKEGIWKDNKFMYVKKPTSTSNSKIEEYKSFCSEIGFTLGTEKFGECVVEAMKKG
jgi:hypothetical protein